MNLTNTSYKRICYLILIALTLLLMWISWRSDAPLNNALIIVKNNDDTFIKNLIIKPTHSLCSPKPLFIILVTSYVAHVELRSSHRRAMPSDLLKSMNATRIFLLAKIPSHEKSVSQEALMNEHEIYGDILQGSFVENYRNLTYKHLMGLQWAATICKEASYIVKVDDDTVFHINRTYNLLSNLRNINKEGFLLGYILNNTRPRRNKQNKWYVTFNEYSRQIYPPYLSGWYYITTPETVKRLTEEAVYHPLFWIDDIFVTGILTEALGIKLKQVPSNYWLEYYEQLECCLRDVLEKSISCDYTVGPNGGRNNLIIEFSDIMNYCTRKPCKTRSESEMLSKTCVAFKDRVIFSSGHAQIETVQL